MNDINFAIRNLHRIKICVRKFKAKFLNSISGRDYSLAIASWIDLWHSKYGSLGTHSNVLLYCNIACKVFAFQYSDARPLMLLLLATLKYYHFSQWILNEFAECNFIVHICRDPKINNVRRSILQSTEYRLMYIDRKCEKALDKYFFWHLFGCCGHHVEIHSITMLRWPYWKIVWAKTLK